MNDQQLVTKNMVHFEKSINKNKNSKGKVCQYEKYQVLSDLELELMELGEEAI